MPPSPVLALTPGEPAGIGPEVCARLATQPRDFTLVIIADRTLMAARARAVGASFAPAEWHGRGADGGLYLLPIEAVRDSTPGRLDRGNAAYVLRTLERAADGCLNGEFDALVTGPVHKGVINDAGIRFTGHTEFFGERCGCPTVMMLAAADLRVALATTHLPLSEVSRYITPTHLKQTITVLHRDLIRWFGLDDPTILVCGLNPHAGESGHLGREEIEVIGPVIADLAAAGLRVRGPVPADTAFVPAALAGIDAVLAMYHDQGLPVLKHHDFAHTVNVTLGLPFVRTSVDHGTALELAGTGRADPSSLYAATTLARRLCRDFPPAA